MTNPDNIKVVAKTDRIQANTYKDSFRISQNHLPLR